ncbi:hypothetical protein Ppb6_02412 [Photorhabdus australis subsp. thailandensis]|uniref:DUF3850 domain-containing protein n=1 Tax=Photorhabdus australis subsp. thailandensis TaxID=2805096 RepID=A0A1C0U335_9GAMM|nr:DUF3850 domain-containing protein [Photorhabdus australis]OCQ52338.1 hypothetical protein Ppb6_02412 [Photorhabdus australis subsp. thailandensis]
MNLHRYHRIFSFVRVNNHESEKQNSSLKNSFFIVIDNGKKKSKFRVNDREYKTGDFLALNKIGDNGNFIGRLISGKITNVTVINKVLYPQIAEEFVLLLF